MVVHPLASGRIRASGYALYSLWFPIDRIGLPFSRFRPRLLQTGQAGEIGRTPLELLAPLLLAFPLLFTLAALVAEFTERSHQFARTRVV